MAVYITQNGNSLSNWMLNTNYVASFQGDYDDLYTTIGGGETNPLSKPTTVFTALTDLNNRKFNLTGGTVTGPTIFTALVTHTAHIIATSIAMSGNLDIATTRFNVNATTGNVHSDGVLDIDGTGNNTFAGSVDITGQLAINVNKFVVTPSTGNTLVAGDLTVNGGEIYSTATNFNLFPDTVVALGLGNTNTTVTSNGNTVIAATKTLTASAGGSLTGTWSSLGSVTTVDINGGTLDNVPIGNDVRSSAKVTTLAANDSVTFTKGTGSTSTTTGTLVVTGGVGISENLYIGGNQVLTGTLSVTNDVTFNKNVTIAGSTTAATEIFKITDGAASPITTFSVDSANGNTFALGTLNVTGSFYVNSTKFIVLAGTGNFSSAGTGDVAGDFRINTSKFTVTATTGDTVTGPNITLQNTSNAVTVVGNTGSTTANVFNTVTTTGNIFGIATVTNLAVNAASAVTINFGPAISGNTIKIGGTAAGTVNITSDVTTGTVNSYTGITTGTLNLATGGASTTNIGGAAAVLNIGTTAGDSIIELRGNATTGTTTIRTTAGAVTNNLFNTVVTTGNLYGVATAVNLAISAVAASTFTFGPAITNNTFKIGSTAAGTINLTSDVTTGIVNAYTGVTTGTVNLATSGASTTNIGGAAANLNLGTTAGNSTLTIRGNATTGTATLATNAATANVFNTNATTVNIAGAGTTVEIGAATGTTSVNNDLTIDGNTTLGNASTDIVTFNANTAYVPNTLNIVLDDAVQTAVSYPVRISHTTSQTTGFAAGMGVGIDWAVETGSGTTRVGATTEFVSTDVTTNSEDFDFVIKTMINGAAPAQIVRANQGYFQIGSTGGTTTLTTLGAANLVINTNNGTNSGNITINQGANANISITPNGTGDVLLVADTVQIGDNNATAYLTTNGTGDLVLNTNSGTNSGAVTIANGINGNITIEPNGTGDVYLKSDTIYHGDANAAVVLTSNGNGSMTLTSNGTADTIINTNGGTNSGAITITNGANGNITVEPNGTGDVLLKADTTQIGDANANATLTTNGTGDLILNTNNGTNSGTFTIKQGANGNIDVTPNGDGLVTLFGIAAIGVKSTTNPTADTTNIAPAIAKATYKVVELTISATDGTNTKISKILVAHNGTTIDFTEYNMMAVGTLNPTYSISLGTTNIEVKTNTTSATTVYKVIATAL